MFDKLFGVEVKTEFNANMIRQTDIFHGGQDLVSAHAERIINLRERSVREALKKLGWLSPEEAEQLRAQIINRNPAE